MSIKAYTELQNEIKATYPSSYGELKLPIAANLEDFDIDLKKVCENLDDIMQQLIAKSDQALEISKTAFAPGFTDLFTGEFTGVVRFDTMFNQSGDLKLVEVNAKWPGGLIMHDRIYSTFLDQPNDRNLDLFLQLFDKNDYIFIMYGKEDFLVQHFVEYEKVKSRGYKVGIGMFEDIVFKDGFAYNDGNKIDVLRFSVSPGRLNENQISLLKSAKLKYINTPDLAAMGDKSLLQGVKNEMIMETTILDESVKDKIIQNKNNYVIKPTNKDEGDGVYIGLDISQDEWEKLVNDNLGKLYLAQEYINVPTQKTKIYVDGELVEYDVYYDFCPHIFYKNGKMIGCGQVLVRYSPNRIVNLMKGGGVGYRKQD